MRSHTFRAAASVAALVLALATVVAAAPKPAAVGAAPPAPRAAVPVVLTDKVVKTDAEWQKVLTPEQYRILRQAGTEIPGTGPFLNNHAKGVYVCAACGQLLYSSDTKFESGTGWPSFWRPFSPKSIVVRKDTTLGMERDEVLCSRCGGHLGHVFDDGPPPTGLRYCMNGAALKFIPTK